MPEPTCPQCGGADRRTITQNYFECTSEVVYTEIATEYDERPDPHSSIGWRRDPYQYVVTRHRACAHKYQEGALTGTEPRCHENCGYYAIGYCVTCERPACSRHSKLVDYKLTCAACTHAGEASLRERGQLRAAEFRAALAAQQELDKRMAAAPTSEPRETEHLVAPDPSAEEIRRLALGVLTKLDVAGRPGVLTLAIQRKRRLGGYASTTEPGYYLCHFDYKIQGEPLEGDLFLLWGPKFLLGRNNNPRSIDDGSVWQYRTRITDALRAMERELR